MTEATEKLPIKLGEGQIEALWEDNLFNQLVNRSEFLSKCDLIPDHFRGKPANVFVGLEMAYRLQANPFMVLQNLYVVHGRPGWAALFLIALINTSGKYAEPLQWRFEGEGKTRKCVAFTRDKAGRLIEGPPVTWAMVEAEGWNKDKPLRDGKGVIKSKWNTLTDLMFQYRSAALFSRLNCPEVSLGLQTREEIEDSVINLEATASGVYQEPEPTAPEPDPERLEKFRDGVQSRAETWTTEYQPEDKVHLLNSLDQFIDMSANFNNLTPDQVRLQALEKLDTFWEAFLDWPERYQPAETSGPAPDPEPPAEAAPDNEAPDPGEKITVATMNAILDECKNQGKAVAALLKDYGLKLLRDTTESKGQEILADLRGI
jgi:hypothetical protein